MRGREEFSKYKRLIYFMTKIISILPFILRKKLFESSRNIKGKKGLAIRYIFMKSLAKKCGDNVSIHPNVFIFSPEKMCIGDNVSIHPMCCLEAAGEIEIGDNVSLAHATSIISTTHNYIDLKTIIKDQKISYNKVIIEENVWIGTKATILNGVIVGNGSIIGAHSLVNRNIEPGLIVGGIPVKVLKKREQE